MYEQLCWNYRSFSNFQYKKTNDLIFAICELFVTHPPNSCVHLYCLFLQYWIISDHLATVTAQKMKFPIKDFFSKCDQIRSLLGNMSKLVNITLAHGHKLRLIFKRWTSIFLIHSQQRVYNSSHPMKSQGMVQTVYYHHFFTHFDTAWYL